MGFLPETWRETRSYAKNRLVNNSKIAFYQQNRRHAAAVLKVGEDIGFVPRSR